MGFFDLYFQSVVEILDRDVECEKNHIIVLLKK